MHQPVVAIVQARMTSTRLPGKVLKEICGQPALQQMLQRVRKSISIQTIVVATTTNKEDDPIVHLCDSLGVHTFRGDEFDVLGRYLAAAQEAKAKSIVRLTGDCPMIDPMVIDEVVWKYLNGSFDYVSNCNVRTFPDGLDVEVFSYEALAEAAHYAVEPFSREHVTPYIRGIHTDVKSGEFKQGDVIYSTDLSHIRWTLDTQFDLSRIRELFDLLPTDFSWLDALSLATKRPALLGIKNLSFCKSGK